jgi:hypothetical protein
MSTWDWIEEEKKNCMSWQLFSNPGIYHSFRFHPGEETGNSFIRPFSSGATGFSI